MVTSKHALNEGMREAADRPYKVKENGLIY